MTPEETMVLKAAALRATAGVYWDEFLQALDGFAGDRMVRLVGARPDQLVNFQGQALAIQHLAKVLRESHTTALKLKERNNG